MPPSRSHSCSRSRPRPYPRTARDIVNSHLADSQPDSNTQAITQAADHEESVALFDLPPEDPQSLEHVGGRRKSRSTERNVQYRARREKEERTRLKSNDTRARNRALGQAQASAAQNRASHGSPECEGPDHIHAEAAHDSGQRGRSTTTCTVTLSLPPTSESTSHTRSQNYNTSNQAPSETQYTYIYESLDHEGLVRHAQEEFGINAQGCDTQTIVNRIRIAEAEQASQMGPARCPSTLFMLPPSPFQVGGGWSQNVLGIGRPSSTPKILGGSNQRSPDNTATGPETDDTATEPETNDTATEPETDDMPMQDASVSARVAAEHTIVACPSCSVDVDVRAPALTRDGTPATVLDTEPSNRCSHLLGAASSHSLGGSLSQYGFPIHPRVPKVTIEEEPEEPDGQDGRNSRNGQGGGDGGDGRNSGDNGNGEDGGNNGYGGDPEPPVFVGPLRGPNHDHIRDEIWRRHLIDIFTRHGIPNAAELVNAALAEESKASKPGGPQPKTNKVPETEADSSPQSQHATHGSSSSPRTYAGSRSHLPSEPIARVTEPTEPNSPAITPSQLIRRERARAFAAKAHAELDALAPRWREAIFAIASETPSSRPQPPSSRPQPRPPLGARGNAVGRRAGGPSRMDPVSAARADMLAFNQAVARGEATSLVESVTRQSERTARCAPPESRQPEDLLDDNEETLAQAEAFAKLRWPLRTGRHRKNKPLARDVSGVERQVLIMAKIHLFAYALVEGVYQTRATYLRWAAAVHRATWAMDLPNRPYVQPDPEIFEIMVNNIATLRGKVKERLREFVARVSGFKQRMTNQNAIQENLARFDEIYHSFHCKSTDPRNGDYENPEIGHCLALVAFSGPNSVGVLYPDYFRDMPLNVVAFCLAIWQFCIEEWADGWRQNGDLGTAGMRDKYHAHLAGLKALRQVAPKRMHRLQDQWRDYAAEYSGAKFVAEPTEEPEYASRMRPDTPEPISVEEMETRLLETARQDSIRERMAQLAAQELETPMQVDEDDEDPASTPSSRPSTPPPEYNEHGILTARSKGKGRRH